MGTDVYTLRKSRKRRIILDDGTKRYVYPYLYSHRPTPSTWGDTAADRVERLAITNTENTWEAMVSTGAPVYHCEGPIEDGRHIYLSRGPNPVWFDCDPYPGVFQGVYRAQGKRLVPAEEYAYESVVLPMQRFLKELRMERSLQGEDPDSRLTRVVERLGELEHEEGSAHWRYHRRLVSSVANAVLLFEAANMLLSRFQERFLVGRMVHVPSDSTVDGVRYRELESWLSFAQAWRREMWSASIDGRHYPIQVLNPDKSGSISVWFRGVQGANVVRISALLANEEETFPMAGGRTLVNPDVVLEGAMLTLDDASAHKVRMSAVFGAPEALDAAIGVMG